MALLFHPDPGSVLMCNFDTGFRPPEMVKTRPIVIVSRRRRAGPALYTVIPLSTSAPLPVEAHHHCLDPRSLPAPYSHKETWAKCDMLYTVSTDRLDRLRVGRFGDGKRRYAVGRLTDADWRAVKNGVRAALDLD